MGRKELAALFEEAASGVPAPALAADAWARARRVRRRRQAAAVLAAAVTVLAVTAASVLPLRGGEGHPAAAPPSASAPAGVDRMPASLQRRSIAPLPGQSTAMVPAQAGKLSEHPVDRAVALVEPHGGEGEQKPLPVYVLGSDGVWVSIDVVQLVPTRDSGGNQADPLRSTALSPDRRRVAFPQPDALVVVDLTTAKVHRIAVPGLNEQVLWWGNRVVLVGRDGAGVVCVDWAAGSADPLGTGLSAGDATGSAAEGAPVFELTGPAGGRRAGGLSVRQWRLGEPGPTRQVPLADPRPAGYRVLEWAGPAVSDGADRVVRAGWGENGSYSGLEILAVVNVRTGAVQRLLDLGRDRVKACCQPLDWVDGDTVLVRTDKEGLVTWNVRTGEITQVVAGPLAATVAIRLR